jgi:hypothetical protein
VNTTTVIKHQSTGARAIRLVGLIAVLFLSAALGIVVGNALRGSEDSSTVGQAATDTTSSAFSLDAIRHLQAARGDAGAELGAPTYADPHRSFIGAGTDAMSLEDYRVGQLRRVTSTAPAQTDPRPHLWAPIDSADDNASLTRPTAR